MLPFYLAIAVVTTTYALPRDYKIPKNVCKKYRYLYDQCLPPKDWICDKLPHDYIDVNPTLLRQELTADASGFHYLKTCSQCIGEPKPYKKKRKYRKKPVCRAVKVPVEYVYRPITDPLTNVEISREVCTVVLNNPPKGKSVQKVYETKCFNGNPKKKDHYCRFDYGSFKEYFCRPTNHVKRTILVYCPSGKGQLEYMKVKIPTACSCVRVSCAVPA